MTLASSTNLFGVAVPYRARIAEETTEQETQQSNNGADHTAWNETTQFDERAASHTELERATSPVMTAPMLEPPSSIETYWSNSQAEFSSDILDAIAHPSLVFADGYSEKGVWERRPNTLSNSGTDSVAQAEAPEHEHVDTGDDKHTPFDHCSQTALREVCDTDVNLRGSENLIRIDALGSEYITAISALPTKHHSTLVQLVR